MEIQRVAKAPLTQAKVNEKGIKGSVSFTKVMEQKQSEIQKEKMNQLLQEIEQQGIKLSESRTVEHLRQYKKLIKQFLQHAVQNGLELSEDRGFNSRGSLKIYRLVKEVDQKLIELTNEILDKEKEGLRTLQLIGEIKGMLINIYS